MLEKKPNCYKCKLIRKEWPTGKAILKDSSVDDDTTNARYFDLPTPFHCGRAFDGDEVAVLQVS